LLVLVLIALVFSSKIDSDLTKQFEQEKKVDFIVNLRNIKYRNLKHKGVSFEDLEIETKAQFIVDTLINFAEISQKPIISYLKAKEVSFDTLWIINAITIKQGTEELARTLAMRPEVESINVDEKYEIFDEPTFDVNNKEKAVEWHLEYVKATEVWKKGPTGKGKIIGLVDTGVNFRHPAVVEHYVGNKNGTFDHDYAWYGPAIGQEPRDTQDHGTHCTGIALGATKDKSVITGASHDSKWIHCHFGGSFAIISKCFQFLLAPTDRQGRNPQPAKRPHVTSHSYGAVSQTRSQLENVVQPCLDAGVHVVVAAANSARCRTITDPGLIPNVLTCGALGFQTEAIASFSSRGPGPRVYNNTLKPEIVAPGTTINSALGNSNNYGKKSGTSMSTPLIAGVIALLWDAVPRLDRKIKETNEILFKSSNHQKSRDCESTTDSPNNVFAYGTINALKAYEMAQELYGNKN